MIPLSSSLNLAFRNNFRVFALYLSMGKVCCEPLTPLFHLSDLRLSVPGYTERMARTLKAVVLTLEKLRQFYKPFVTTNEGNKSLGLVTPRCPFALQEM